MMKENIKVIYCFVTGETSEITVDILVKQGGVPSEKAIEFYKLLQSFEHGDEKLERKETRRHTPFSKFNDNINPPILKNEPLSLENQLIYNETKKLFWDIAEKVLSPKQKKRLIYRIKNGLTFEEIARLEGTSHPAIVQSVNAALKKIKKYF